MSDALEKLRALLWEQWDPIGVNETDCPKDEYNSYAVDILSMLSGGAGKREIAEYLSLAQTEKMGMSWRDIHGPIAEAAVGIFWEANH